MESQIEKLQRILKVSADEAREIAEADCRIDKGEKLFTLSPEQEKVSKQARSVARAPTAYNFSKRERKEDADKRFLMGAIEKLLTEQVCAERVNLTNPEREIEFVCNDRKFKITLSAPRS